MSMSSVWLPLALLSTVWLAACGSAPYTEAAGAAAQPVTATPEYRIGPDDQLRIDVFGHPELSRELPVRPDGHISMPLVEDIGAAGKTSTELARDLETQLAEYVRSPKVSVMIVAFRGASADRIRIVGAAAKPQALPFRTNMTLLDAMIEVGGLGEFAAGNRAHVVRIVDGKEKRIPVRIKDLLGKGRMSANIKLLPGDVVVIPESFF
jgi:polysaccharide biosynthesis/export protein